MRSGFNAGDRVIVEEGWRTVYGVVVSDTLSLIGWYVRVLAYGAPTERWCEYHFSWVRLDVVAQLGSLA